MEGSVALLGFCLGTLMFLVFRYALPIKKDDTFNQIDLNWEMEKMKAGEETDKKIQEIRMNIWAANQERRNKMLTFRISPSVAKHMYDNGRISLKEYTKFMKDERGDYVPKLKKDEE